MPKINQINACLVKAQNGGKDAAHQRVQADVGVRAQLEFGRVFPRLFQGVNNKGGKGNRESSHLHAVAVQQVMRRLPIVERLVAVADASVQRRQRARHQQQLEKNELEIKKLISVMLSRT